MLLLLGIASESAEVEGMCTMLVDFRPEYFSRNKLRRPLFVLFCCVSCFFFAMPMVTDGGMYVFQLCDSYGANGICLLSARLENIILINSHTDGWSLWSPKAVKSIFLETISLNRHHIFQYYPQLHVYTFYWNQNRGNRIYRVQNNFVLEDRFPIFTRRP